jgi:hypothetical protein
LGAGFGDSVGAEFWAKICTDQIYSSPDPPIRALPGLATPNATARLFSQKSTLSAKKACLWFAQLPADSMPPHFGVFSEETNVIFTGENYSSSVTELDFFLIILK